MAGNINAQVRAVNRKLKQSVTPVRAGASSALNKTASRIKSRVTKAVSADVQVQQKHVRKRVYIRKSTGKTMKALVTAYRRDIPVISLGIARTTGTNKMSVSSRDSRGRFNTRQHSGNTAIRVGNRTYQNAFINQVQGGGWQVMRRKGRARYPLEVLKVKISPSVDRHTPTIAREQMQTEYPRIAKHEIDYRMKKYASR